MSKHFASTLALALALLLPFAAGAESKYDFELYDLNDKLVSLKKTRKAAQMVVIDFFSSSCMPCKRAIPRWKKIHRRWSYRRVKVLIVAVPDGGDRDKSLKRIRSFFKKQKVAFPVVWDKYTLIAKRYGVAKKGGLVLPQAFLLDGRSKLLYRAADPQTIDREIARRIK